MHNFLLQKPGVGEVLIKRPINGLGTQNTVILPNLSRCGSDQQSGCRGGVFLEYDDLDFCCKEQHRYLLFFICLFL